MLVLGGQQAFGGRQFEDMDVIVQLPAMGARTLAQFAFGFGQGDVQRALAGLGASQQELFPKTFEFPADDVPMIQEIQGDLRKLGIDLREFGGNTYVLNGVPEGAVAGQEKEMIDSILESVKNQSASFKEKPLENLLKSMVSGMAMQYGTALTRIEQEHLVDELFKCSIPDLNPYGKPVYTLINSSELEKRFRGINHQNHQA